MLNVSLLLSRPNEALFDAFVRGTFMEDNPYPHIVFGISPLPNEKKWSFLDYFLPLMILSPLLFNVYALAISLVVCGRNGG